MSSVTAATKAIFAIDNVDDLRRVSEVINARFREIQRRMAVMFQVGDQVQFKSRSGQTVTGTVQKVNQKTILVKTPTMNWKVAASLLQKAA